MFSSYIFNLACDILGKKWRAATLYVLQNGPMRFSEIKNALPGCSVKVLSQVLKDMTEQGLLIRKQYNQVPLKVTYEIHPDWLPLIIALREVKEVFTVYVKKNGTRLKVDKSILKHLQSSETILD